MSKDQQTVHIEDRQGEEQLNNKLDDSFDERYDDQNPNNNHEFDDDDLKGILDEQGTSKQEMMLKFKVEQLQKICNSLSETNRKLINKISKMQDQLQQKNNKSQSQNSAFVDEYSQLNIQFTQIEQLINQYRQSLNDFQSNVLNDMKSKDKTVSNLESQIKALRKSIKQLQIENQQLDKNNKQLQTRNQGLILEVQNLEKNNMWLEQRVNAKNYGLPNFQNQSTKYDNSYIDDQFSTQMQTQLQSIIDKLVKQLQYERNLKKKMNQQIKRISLELLESEKQIMDKNKKLYALQMKLLKNNKTNINVDITQKIRTKPDDEKTQRIQNKVQHKVNFKTFTLMQMINQEIDEDITARERKIIALKIFDYYQRKIQKGDYTAIVPESLLIHNFNHKKPQLISVRKTDTGSYQEQVDQGQQNLIWNLAFIIQNIFRDSSLSNKQFSNILSLTSEMLDKQYQNNRQDMKQLKSLLTA